VRLLRGGGASFVAGKIAEFPARRSAGFDCLFTLHVSASARRANLRPMRIEALRYTESRTLSLPTGSAKF
jgi:hypothetical protein